MSVEKIKEQILAEVVQQATEILNGAEEEKKHILSEADKEIEKIKTGIVEKGKSSIDTDLKRQLAKANVDAKMKFLAAKEKGIDEAVALGMAQLAATFSSDSEALQRLLLAGCIALEGGELSVAVRNADISRVNKTTIEKAVFDKTGIKTTILIEADDTITKIGGGIVKKGNIWVNNTAEAILDRKYREVRLKVAETLYNQK